MPPRSMQTTSIDVERLRLLEEKERAHDDYRTALRTVKRRLAQLELRPLMDPKIADTRSFNLGYVECLHDLSEAILQASRLRDLAASREGTISGEDNLDDPNTPA